jgi:tryptophan synthase beta subunit
VLIERENRLWYGQYGGCFIADAFTLACDRYYKRYCEVIETEDFLQEYEELKKRYADDSFRFIKTETEKLTLCFVSENLYPILGTALLAKKLGKKQALCGARYADEAMLCARVCKYLGVPLKIFLSSDIACISSLITHLSVLGVEIDGKTCNELFNLPEMYAFQAWVASPEDNILINCRSNVGAFPQTNITTDFAKEYGYKLWSAIKNGSQAEYKRIVVPCVSGSLALSLFKGISVPSTELVCVECDANSELVEELDSYCGTFTKIMRNNISDRVLAPELAYMIDEGFALRVMVDPETALCAEMPSNISEPLSLQSLAALSYCAEKHDGKETLCVVRGMRWGAVL